MSECIFCQIANKKAPAKIEYEDNSVIAFWDINKTAPIHLLIIPKKHIESLNELKNEDDELLWKIIHVAKELAKKKKVKKSGYRLVVNTGPWSGQIVNHLHFHFLAG